MEHVMVACILICSCVHGKLLQWHHQHLHTIPTRYHQWWPHQRKTSCCFMQPLQILCSPAQSTSTTCSSCHRRPQIYTHHLQIEALWALPNSLSRCHCSYLSADNTMQSFSLPRLSTLLRATPGHNQQRQSHEYQQS